ncbi:YndJ family transporter [Cellulomonas sp. URHB0016]
MSTVLSEELTPAALGVVRVAVALGAVVVLPTGLRLLRRGAVPVPTSPAWVLVGALAAVSVWFPVGPVAALLAVPFAVAGAVLAGCAVRLLLGRPDGGLVVAATAVALGTPVVGAVALVAERAGKSLLGFSEEYLALTVPHMLFAGFGACLVVGLLARAVVAPDGVLPRAVRVAAVATPVGVVVVLVGYFATDAVELVGAVLLTVGLWAAAAAAWRVGSQRRTRSLLQVGSVAVAGSMVLAVWWALGEATGLAHPGPSAMVATHGVLNAGGFVLCTLLGLRRELRAGLVDEPDHETPDAVTYYPVGGTRSGVLPSGFRHLTVRHRILTDAGEHDRARLGEALRTWQVHSAAHVQLLADAELAEPGVRVVTRIGVPGLRLSEPCEVVWSTPDGFGYGTLPGHLFHGEEAFTVELDGGALWLVVVAYSVPAVGWVRALGPLVVVAQRLYLRQLAKGARRITAQRASVAGAAR